MKGIILLVLFLVLVFAFYLSLMCVKFIYLINFSEMEISILLSERGGYLYMLVTGLSIVVLFFCNMYFGLPETKYDLIMFWFVGSMLYLIVSSSPFSMIWAWDWLGFSSIMLILYYSNQKALEGAWITFFYNRCGDLFFVILLGFSFLEVGGYSNLANNMFKLFFLVCMTKSAQTPFHTWLPKAMVAPTPISSLVHSSTLVTAGVVLLIFNLESMINTLSLVFCIGALTVAVSGLLSLYFTDLKEKIAYSTMNQMGWIFIVLGLGNTDLALFMVVVHGVAKAHLFVSFGTQMINNDGSQGESAISMNSTSFVAIPLMASLGGAMGFSGGSAKHFLIGHHFSSYYVILIFVFYITILYSLDLLYCFFSHSGKICVGAKTFNCLMPAVFLVLCNYTFHESRMSFNPSMVMVSLFAVVSFPLIQEVQNSSFCLKSLMTQSGNVACFIIQKTTIGCNNSSSLATTILKPVKKLVQMPTY